MPQTTQIVPKYSFPLVETVINDNTLESSEIDAGVVATDQIYPYLAVFRSPKGKDNTLVPIKGITELHKQFGYGNYKKYGQPFMMAEALLSQENVTLNVMRIMPDDAYYANDVLSIWYKEDVENKKFYIKFTHKSLEKNSDITNFKEIKDDMIARASKLDGSPNSEGVYVDSEGFTQIPCALFISSGRGSYGNDYRWRISLNTDYEKGYGFKMYSYNCLNMENGTTVDANYVGSIVSSTKISDASFINDVIEDSEVSSIPMDIHVFEENMEKLYEIYAAFWKKVEEADPSYKIDTDVYVDDIPDMDCFDPFFGKAVAQAKQRVTKSLPFIQFVKEYNAEAPVSDTITIYKNDDNSYYTQSGAYFTEAGVADVSRNINVDELATKITEGSVSESTISNPDYDANEWTKTPNVITVNNIVGNELANGDDGSFPSEEAVDDMYIRAFSGSLDKLILSSRRMPAESLFDANFSMPVKAALAKLALFRNDALLYLDCGIMDTLSEADINLLEKDFSVIDALEEDFDVFSHYLISYNLHHYRVKEPNTGKRIPVTITYFLASNLPTHFRINGYHVPFVNGYARLSGHIKNSLEPSIEVHENDLKEILYNSRFNYFEAIGENVFERSTQSTSYIANENYTSDLIEENNVITMMILKRMVEQDVRSLSYNFTGSDERSDFRDYIKEKYRYMVGTQLYSLDVKFEQSKFEFDRQIVHLYLAIQFRRLSKQVIVEIDVNKQQYDEEQ